MEKNRNFEQVSAMLEATNASMEMIAAIDDQLGAKSGTDLPSGAREELIVQLPFTSKYPREFGIILRKPAMATMTRVPYSGR